jgi:hypothetical protein
MNTSLQAGAARRSINPHKPLQLFGYPHVKRVSTGVHEPLYASALWLDNGEAAQALVSLDILQLDPPTARRVRGAAARALGIPEAAVFMSCTHTHSGPVTAEFLAWKGDHALPSPDREYLALIEREVVAAVTAAKAGTVPAELTWTTADATGVGGNRLAKGGLADPEAGVLSVRRAGGGAHLGLVIVYSMHPTVLHEDTTLANPDFPGYARRHLEEAFGADLVTLYYMGTAGNQSPRYYVTGQTFAEAERLGRKLGEAVRQAVAGLCPTCYDTHLTLAAGLRQVDLPRRQLPSLAEAEQTLAEYRATFERLKREQAGHGPIRTAECAIFGAEGTVALARAEATGVLPRLLPGYTPADVQAVRIHDEVIVGWPGEYFVEYGLELKGRSPRKCFVATLVNGELQGYIVTPEAAIAGGYEATNAIFAPTAGRLVVEASLDLISQL